ncbi:MAG: hypothetical protein AB7R69_04340 [Candidatus Babeliales bacterium]
MKYASYAQLLCIFFSCAALTQASEDAPQFNQETIRQEGQRLGSQAFTIAEHLAGLTQKTPTVFSLDKQQTLQELEQAKNTIDLLKQSNESLEQEKQKNIGVQKSFEHELDLVKKIDLEKTTLDSRKAEIRKKLDNDIQAIKQEKIRELAKEVLIGLLRNEVKEIVKPEYISALIQQKLAAFDNKTIIDRLYYYQKEYKALGMETEYKAITTTLLKVQAYSSQKSESFAKEILVPGLKQGCKLLIGEIRNLWHTKEQSTEN